MGSLSNALIYIKIDPNRAENINFSHVHEITGPLLL